MRNINWLAVFVGICFVIGMVIMFVGFIWVIQQILIFILGGFVKW